MKNKKSKNLKIGIIGLGMVGGTIKRYFDKKKSKVLFYDKGKNIGSIGEVNRADVVFICVPTPFNEVNGFDLSCVKDACGKIFGSKIIIIKSTVLPGVTEKLQQEYPQHKFLFNPEFLTEKTADDDFRNSERQLVGYTDKSKNVAKKIMQLLPRAPFEKIIPASEAEMIKYFNNTFNAMKVIFANQMYDLCEAVGVDYDCVMKCAAVSRFIKTEDHLHIFHKGYRGYGGKCLPKDIRALIEFADKKNVDLKLHKIIEEINNELIENQNLKRKF